MSKKSRDNVHHALRFLRSLKFARVDLVSEFSPGWVKDEDQESPLRVGQVMESAQSRCRVEVLEAVASSRSKLPQTRVYLADGTP